MSNSVNKVFLLGRIGKTPELRHTNNGTAFMNLSLATSFRKRNDKGEWADGKTEWHRVTVWGKTAEGLDRSKKVVKGLQVFVEGHLQTSSWEDRTGTKRYSTSIQCENFTFLADGKSQYKKPEEGKNDNRNEDNYEPPYNPEEDYGKEDTEQFPEDELPF